MRALVDVIEASRIEARPRDTIHPVRQWGALATIVICSVIFARPVWTQDISSITDNVFFNPGARSIGLGGAFAAIADDATAAFANPAGLVQILRPEISAEIRGTAGRFDSGTPYGPSNGVSGLGFFSFVYPARSWAFALYSHQVASLDISFSGPHPVTRELSVRSFAGAAAFEIHEHLSVGAGLSYYNGNSSAVGSADGFSDADWGFNLGILWTVATAWKVAGFYRQGPEFDSNSNPVGSNTRHLQVADLKNAAGISNLSFPDEYGLGVAFQPGSGGWTFGFEWDRIGSAVDPLLVGNAVSYGGSEYHLGTEYAVLRWKPVVAIRAGFWTEPASRRQPIAGPEVMEIATSKTSTHVAFGFGLAFKRFQIDAGVDIFERAVVGSASVVYSF